MNPMFDRIAFIGIGLIGSSLARVIKKDGLAGHVAVCTRSQETLSKAEELGLGDSYVRDPAQAVLQADLVIICTPLSAYETVAKTIAPALQDECIVTDVGSVKGSVIAELKSHLPNSVHLVPGHPVAGTEHSGPEFGSGSLFEGRWCILTPEEETSQAAVDKVAGLWRAAGCDVEILDPDYHDLVLALTSHLPHLIAYSIVDTATCLEKDLMGEVIKFSAGGFRDFTRIAGSDPVMWRDVFVKNREAVLEVLGRFTEDLTALQRAIRRGEGEQLLEVFSRTREVRREVINAKQA